MKLGSKSDDEYTSKIVEALNKYPLVVIPSVDKYSGSATMLIAVVYNEKYCPIGQIRNVEEIEYGFEPLIENKDLLSGRSIPELELWYENRYVKSSGRSKEDATTSERDNTSRNDAASGPSNEASNTAT